MTGYSHPGYSESLAEFGTPHELPRCGGWILKRQIPGFPHYDGMGCYPLFSCQDWAQLEKDLEELGSEVVSLSLVADPFGAYELSDLRRCFDKTMPFKEHFVIDLHCPDSSIASKHHRRNVEKALGDVHVERCWPPDQFVDEWTSLYAALIERHNIRGIAAFSRSAFLRQLQVPGIVVFRAVHNEVTVGMMLWYVQEDVGYYHLGASSDAGYKSRASFALMWSAIEHFRLGGLRWLNLGAGAGVKHSSTDGLTRFKRGWATGTRPAYFCARIFDRKRYMEIVKAKNIRATDYFPAYRKGEFSNI